MHKLLLEKWQSLQKILDTSGHLKPQGYSERYLAELLRENATYSVLTSAKLRYHTPKGNEFYEEWEPKEDSRNYYYPDILLMHEQSKLIINVEIDEPYSLIDGTPIHYVCYDEDFEEYGYMKRENFRNSTLAAKGMVVVRFAEEQVISYPQSCLELIDKIIEFVDWYDGKKEWKEEYVLSTWTDKMKIQRWGIEEALEMAKKNYRQEYLSKVADVVTFVKENTKTFEEAKWAPKASTVSQADLSKSVMDAVTKAFAGMAALVMATPAPDTAQPQE